MIPKVLQKPKGKDRIKTLRFKGQMGCVGFENHSAVGQLLQSSASFFHREVRVVDAEAVDALLYQIGDPLARAATDVQHSLAGVQMFIQQGLDSIGVSTCRIPINIRFVGTDPSGTGLLPDLFPQGVL